MLKYNPLAIFENMDKYSLGFEDTFRRLTDMGTSIQKTVTSNFPPFNIVKNKENSYTIELAVAGFGRSDLDITMNDGVLTIAGHTQNEKVGDESNFLYKGIAERAFTRAFTVADTVKIRNAELVNGMLKIYLDNVMAAKEALKIPINDGTPQLLNEDSHAKNDPK